MANSKYKNLIFSDGENNYRFNNPSEAAAALNVTVGRIHQICRVGYGSVSGFSYVNVEPKKVVDLSKYKI